jgi:hypothetical protein
MQSVVVVTGYDDSDSTSSYQEVFDLTLPSKQRYCRERGYDLVVLRSIPKRYPSLDIGIRRLMVCLELTEMWDTVAWIDADTVITGKTNLESFVDDNHCFYASHDYGDWAIRGNYINTGNFVLKNGESLITLKTITNQYSVSFNNEQEMMNTLIRQGMKWIRVLSNEYLGSHPKEIPLMKIQNGDGIQAPNSKPWKETDLMAHLAGIPNKQRVELLKSKFEKYL